MGQKTASDVEPEKKKLDLSAAQVAGSSLATVAAALLASQMGVYGTILGAGVVSVVATAGGPVIQHFFRRTGDQIRENARPRSRQVPPFEGERPAGDKTAVLAAGAPSDGEFGEATVHGTRRRGVKRTAVASGLAFALAIGGLGTYEAVAGTSISSDGGTLLTGGVKKAADHRPSPTKNDPDGGGEGEKGGKDGGTPHTGTSPTPSRSHQGGGTGGERSPDPGTSPSPQKSAPVDPSPQPDPVKPTPPGPTPGTGGATGGGGSGQGAGGPSAGGQGAGGPSGATP
ncbi:hypothetical protein ACIOD1_16740 [Streptomyces sp. NPDC088097]|uniref:hypothetical protein n=1 Tax=Streptomyces sp. NPDC088097 TaxID=3365823 RepID=UPI0037FE22A9